QSRTELPPVVPTASASRSVSVSDRCGLTETVSDRTVRSRTTAFAAFGGALAVSEHSPTPVCPTARSLPGPIGIAENLRWVSVSGRYRLDWASGPSLSVRDPAEMFSLPRSARLRPLRFGVAVRQDGSVSCPCLGSLILGRTVAPTASRPVSAETLPFGRTVLCPASPSRRAAAVSSSRSDRCGSALPPGSGIFPCLPGSVSVRRCDSAGQCLLPVSDRRDCHHGSVVL